MTAAAPGPPVPAVDRSADPAAVDTARRLVAEAVAALEQTRDLPVPEHVAVLDGVHRSLQDALAALDGV